MSSTDATYSAQNPFSARMSGNQELNGDGSAKDTRHIEIDLSGSALSYTPGDSLGVVPINDPALVEAIVARCGGDGSVTVAMPKSGEEVSFAAALSRCEITRVPKALVGPAAERSENAELKAAADDRAVMKTFSDGRDLLDLLECVPEGAFTPAELLAGLRPLMHRLYSIASSIDAHPEQVDLTVGVVAWESHGRPRGGVCSSYLGLRRQPGDEIGVFVHEGKNFRLPEDGSTDIIMVGPGTGIAPFRAFLEQRIQDRAAGRNWLFFGDQHEATDYLYREQFEAWKADGKLDRIDLAFSRDQAEKVYVQHRMAEQAAELWAWLDAGAHFYVCGDALRMAKDVDAMLHTIAQEQGGMDEDAAKAWIKDLKKAKRYQRDVYAV